MGSWVDETLANLHMKQVSSELAVAENRLRRAQQPHVWGEVKKWMQENCKELNDKAGRRILNFDPVVIWRASVRLLNERGRVRATLNVTSDEDAGRLRYECGAGKGEFIFEANAEDSSVSIRDAYHRHFTPEEVGRTLLDMLMKSPF